MFNIKENLKQVKSAIIWSNILFTVGPILSAILIPSFIPQYKLYLDSNPLRYALSFDAIVFVFNKYMWEPSYAFLPIYTYLLKFIEFTTSIFFENNHLATVLLGLLVNKILTVLNCALLMNFAHSFDFLSKKTIKLIGILFLFNPSAIFHHSLYSEPIFMLFTLIGITLAFKTKQQAKNSKQYILKNLIGLIFFSLSTLVRTTGMFYSLIYGIPILTQLYHSLKSKHFLNSLKITITGSIVILFFILPFIIYLIIGYHNFCNDQIQSFFCNNPIPNIYSAVEDVFWDVGFMKYYFKKQQMQIIFGLFTIGIIIMSHQSQLYRSMQLIGLNISLGILMVIIVFYANVQSGTRFISTHPIFYFNLGYHLMKNKWESTVSSKIIIFYFVMFTMFGMIFFPARFSWC